MTQRDLLTLVTQILGEFTKSDDIQPEHDLVRELKLDSVDTMDALQRFEDELGLNIPTDILPQLQTVQDLVLELEKRVQPAGGEQG